MLGTCANRAAADVLQALITGRGTAVPDQSARFEVDGVKVLRPVRDIAVRWLVRYAYLRLPKEQFVYSESDAGIHDIIERFIEHAGADNAASVHNIVKTADKLNKNEGERCLLCKSVLNKVTSDEAEPNCGDCQYCGCSPKVGLCEGCRACVERADGEGNRVSELIEEITKKERKRVGMESMRKQIEEFLL
ncbi:Cytoplasmic tRNA 2-thiolation protein 2 [Gracilariopsis chorda]|uniref:Cytoplasmic tRNA 2-thiolation protein 2 n=1 Tax=Gracilariopsis chorda TaxID=448386 RepID=A0A2V3IV68_9FLOR|nr:Cytoplasmic tRNA 2-thiolation protein 2 [Gracilariopsis chorda]|eukprot:PXF46036.1 Cytoplasmic tRNA 2-thiolation protein 2 [Gracilariopsis chorda]